MNLAFSDHHLSGITLREFGSVVKTINLACQDPQLAYWIFVKHVSDHHPSILTADLPPELEAKIEAVTRGLILPEVKVLPSMRHGRDSW